MPFSSLQPFVPSGSNFNASKQLFTELCFTIAWDAGDYIGFTKDNSSFILQNFNNKEFAQNFMISVAIDDAAAFTNMLMKKTYTKNLA